MIKTGLFDQSHLTNLKKAVDVYARRHAVTAQNISNVETEGYQARELKFEELLSGAGMRLEGTRTQDSHLAIGRSDIATTEGQNVESGNEYDNGVNNVDIDQQMTELATTDLSYRLATRLLSMRYTILRGAIRGSSR